MCSKCRHLVARPRSIDLDTASDKLVDNLRGLLQLVHGDPLVRGVGLFQGTGAEYDRRDPIGGQLARVGAIRDSCVPT